MREFEKIKIGERKEKKISKEEMIESLRNWLRKPEDFVDRITEKFPPNKWPGLLETIKELKEKMPGKTDRKIVNTAIFFEIIKESPEGILLKDLAEKSKLHQNTVFRHLKELKERNLIKVGDFGKKGIIFETKKFPGTLPELILKILKEKEKTSLKELSQEISELLGRGVDRTTLMRRVRELENEGKIGVKKRIEREKTAIFLPEKEAEVRSYPEIVFKYIKENPGGSIRGVAKELGMWHSTVDRIVSKLLSEGKIAKFKIGRRSELYDKKYYEGKVRETGSEPTARAVEMFIVLEKYGLFPTKERLEKWTLDDVDKEIMKDLKDKKKIVSGIGEVIYDRALKNEWLKRFKRLNEIKPKELGDILRSLENKKPEEIKKFREISGIEKE